MLVSAITFVVLAGLLTYLLWAKSRQLKLLTERYASIADVDAEVAARRETLAQLARSIEAAESEHSQRCAKLASEYDSAFDRYKALQHELSLVEENREEISFGLYKPHYDFATSEEYKDALDLARVRQRTLIKSGEAATCRVEWSVGGSKRDGSRMQKQYLKLMLRAFNGECDAAVANVSWNNATKMEERVRRTFDAVNQLGHVMQMSVTSAYLQLKLAELHLAHEYQEKRHAEREEQRRIREELREEEKAQRECQKAQDDAEKEEARYQKALESARREADAATGGQLSKLTEQIAAFEAKLDEARRAKERAISRAQLTKSGFVYVISNIGSFGEKVFKIGMTRRMEPMERIQELGDASVPFPFDLHAMLYSDNAPQLEGALHALFSDRRVNMVNPRKEFYRDVEFAEIETFVRARGLSAQFIRVPEAKEFRETTALRAEADQRRARTDAPPRFEPQLFSTAAGGRA